MIRLYHGKTMRQDSITKVRVMSIRFFRMKF